MTSAPFRAAATAADTPAEPPPITNTSVSALTGVERGFSSMKRCIWLTHFIRSIARARTRKPQALPHLPYQPEQRLFRALLFVPHGALFDHRLHDGGQFFLLRSYIT